MLGKSNTATVFLHYQQQLQTPFINRMCPAAVQRACIGLFVSDQKIKPFTMKLFQILILLFCLARAVKLTWNLPLDTNIAIPWNDTSAAHPKNAAFSALIQKYQRLGLPGISLLVRDKSGTWVGATGLFRCGEQCSIQCRAGFESRQHHQAVYGCVGV
jgi:hypothetical protein